MCVSILYVLYSIFTVCIMSHIYIYILIYNPIYIHNIYHIHIMST